MGSSVKRYFRRWPTYLENAETVFSKKHPFQLPGQLHRYQPADDIWIDLIACTGKLNLASI